jgi:hypothetical protein
MIGVDSSDGVPTVVPSARSLRSSVVPAGTATFDKTIVEQVFCAAIAEAAPVAPEKVQLARFSRVLDGAITGSATGEAITSAAEARSTREPISFNIMMAIALKGECC